MRARRSCHAVPGSNPRFLEKAQGLDSDQVFLDIEDSVAPIAKPDARKNIVEVLNTGDWGHRVRTVRVNDWTTQWTYKDVIEVVEGAGANLDCIMLPKVQTAAQVQALDTLLTQIETTMGFEVGRIGIEAQIENALGLINVDDSVAVTLGLLWWAVSVIAALAGGALFFATGAELPKLRVRREERQVTALG